MMKRIFIRLSTTTHFSCYDQSPIGGTPNFLTQIRSLSKKRSAPPSRSKPPRSGKPSRNRNHKHRAADANDKPFASFNRRQYAESKSDGRVLGIIPPALLLPTASEYAYIASAVVQRTGINPNDVFQDIVKGQRSGKSASDMIAIASGEYHSIYEKPEDLPLVAVLGRSNVGKSSLLNSLMRKDLAVTSKQPGRTQRVYYYGWKENNNESTKTSFCLVDLPGYGYAVGPDKAVEEWQHRTQAFLKQASGSSLRRLYLLLDARHGANTMDYTVMGWLEEAGIPYTAVLTKADAASKSLVVRYTNDVCMRYDQKTSQAESTGEPVMLGPLVHVTSSRNKTGLSELLSAIETELMSGNEYDSEWTDGD